VAADMAALAPGGVQLNNFPWNQNCETESSRLSCDIFDKRSQPEYAGIEMIRMPHVHSNISMTAKLGFINRQFYRFLRLCSCKKFFVFQMVSLIVFRKAKGYPLQVLLKRTRGLVLKEKFLLEFPLLAFSE